MEISNCCSAPVYEETDICSECKEHCEVIEEETNALDQMFGNPLKQIDGLILQARELKEQYAS